MDHNNFRNTVTIFDYQQCAFKKKILLKNNTEPMSKLLAATTKQLCGLNCKRKILEKNEKLIKIIDK